MSGENILLTGEAGTGKSFILEEIIKTLKFDYNKIVYVTAATGIAACNISGMTFHSFSGIGLGNGTVKQMYDKINNNRTVKKRWREVDVLIIDEISMINAKLFDNVEFIARKIRKIMDEPFGGIQIILSGDFLQLPPIDKIQKTGFCFEAKSWNKVIDTTVQLMHVFRQDENSFKKMLSEIRQGLCTEKTCKMLRNRIEYNTLNEINCTRLYTHRNEMSGLNNNYLGKLKSKIFEYVASDGSVRGMEKLKHTFTKNCPAVKLLRLKLKARVMLLKNIDTQSGLVNGSVGIIKAFKKILYYSKEKSEKAKKIQTGWKLISKCGYWPIVKFENGNTKMLTPEKWERIDKNKIVIWREQIPLCLAWAYFIYVK